MYDNAKAAQIWSIADQKQLSDSQLCQFTIDFKTILSIHAKSSLQGTFYFYNCPFQRLDYRLADISAFYRQSSENNLIFSADNCPMNLLEILS